MLKTLKENKEYTLFIFILLAFVYFKIPHLSIPLFWDEMGVYGKSIFYLLDNEIGLMPKYLDPELSRGHPMLYVFLSSIFSFLFGKDYFSMHAFNLLLSVFCLFSLFFISKKLFDKKVALNSVLILVFQPLFLAQSILVLPEIMLVVFMLWSIYFFLKEKWILYFISTALALLTKETAVFMPPVLAFCLIVWNLFYYRKLEFKKSFIIFSPFLIFFLFLIIQKAQNGWYFFPYHNPFEGDKRFFDFQIIYQKFKDFFHFILVEQGRVYLFGLSFFFLGAMFFTMTKKTKYILLVLIAMILGLVLFSSTNHFMKRYMILALYLSSIIIAVVLNKLFQNRFYVQLFFIAIFSIVSLKHLNSNTFKYDENMSYSKFVSFQKDLTHFLENQEDWKDGVTITSNFPMLLTFEDNRYGFSSKNTKVRLNHKIESDTKYIIETNPGSWRNFQKPNNYTQIEFPSQGFNSVKIYRKND